MGWNVESIYSDLVWGPAGQWGFGFQAQNTNDVEGGMLAYAQIDHAGFSSPFVMIQTDGYNLACVRGDKSPARSPSGRYLAFVNDTSGIARILSPTPTAAHAGSSPTATSPIGNICRRAVTAQPCRLDYHAPADQSLQAHI